MPLFMDVHEKLPEGATSKDVADAHAADLKVQGKYGVKYVRYFMDEQSGKVWCVSDAPNAEASLQVHKEAHGLMPDRIFPVVEGS
ncbi:MAG TPA: DUF4242 domain-containing protein [Candidatus Limnocylindria bacterium]|nr:DUF4242 domain-containing protein [Candidatus Limnocylindria bacterium]